MEPQLDNFINIVDLLEALGVEYQIDIASGAGFEYYTGVIFQLFLGEEKIGGGGRYDALLPSMGGGDIPASGFALYLDRLMNLVKAGALAKPPAEKIWVRGESGKDVTKEAFGDANLLREAGYVVELDLGGQEPADSRWTLNIQSEEPLFVLRDKVKSSQVEAQNIEGVLALLENKGANENSPA